MNHVYVRDFIFQDAGASTANGNELDLQAQSCSVDIHVIWSAGTSAGVIKIEEAQSTAYAGTWATLATVSWTAASKVDNVKMEGTFKYIRCRISTTVVGGTVTVTGDVN